MILSQPRTCEAADSEANKMVKLLPSLLADKIAQDSVTVCLCRNFTCQAPLVGVAAIEAALSVPKETK